MSKYGTWRPVTRYQTGTRRVAMTPRRLNYHTAVSNATPSMFSYFEVDGRATPHFYVGRDGEVEQYIDTDYRSSAALEGNHDNITVETWDGYGTGWQGSNVPPWTDAQVEALAQLAAWCHERHGIPLVQLPSSRPGTQGVGWHRLGCDGNFPEGLLAGRVSGGELWSSSAGKVCPGDNRIRQVVDAILPRARTIANPAPQPQEDDMFSDKDRATLNELAKGLSVFRTNTANRDQAAAKREREMLTDLDNVNAGLKSLEEGKATAGSIEALSAKVSRVRQRLADKIEKETA